MSQIYKTENTGKKCILIFFANFFLILLISLTTPFIVRAQTAVSTTPQTAEGIVRQGLQFSKEKQFDKAVELFKQAITLNPNLAAAYHGLGNAYINMGRASEALEPLKTAARLDPDNAVIHLNLAIDYTNLRQGSAALSELETAKKLAPTDDRIYIQMGNVLHNNFGRIQDALKMYLEAKNLNPTSPTVYHNIGLMYMRLGKFSEAIEPLEEALRLEPNFRNARYLLSDAYSNTGRYLESAESWSKFLAIVPNGPEALTKMTWNYMYAGGHGREAAAGARTYINVYGWNQSTSAYMVILTNIGCRQSGNNKEAKAIAVEAAKKLDSSAWPYSIIRYFNGEMSDEELLNAAADNDKKTEVHTYLGMDELLKENKAAAKTHFEWVKKYGNPRFFEYPLAIEELKRLSN